MTSSVHSLDTQYHFRVIPEYRIATEDNTRDNRTLTMVKGQYIFGQVLLSGRAAIVNRSIIRSNVTY